MNEPGANPHDHVANSHDESVARQVDHNIESIVAMQRREGENVSLAQRRVETLRRLIVRPSYLYTLLLTIGAWIGFNLGAKLLGATALDVPPFAMLDTAMTFISLITTTVVLIAQSRQAKLEQQHAHLDLQVNLLTEQKVTKLIHLMEELRRDLPMVKNRDDPQANALQERADAEQLITAIAQTGLTSGLK